MRIYVFNQIVVFVVLLNPVCQQFLEIHYLIGPFFFLCFFPYSLGPQYHLTKRNIFHG